MLREKKGLWAPCRTLAFHSITIEPYTVPDHWQPSADPGTKGRTIAGPLSEKCQRNVREMSEKCQRNVREMLSK